MAKLDGKVALITGAAAGLGEGISTAYAKYGKIYIDGKEQTQAVSFCPEEMAGSFGPYEVPEDSYFVMGDNRNNSLDSRYWDNTYVKKETILAKAGFRYWPLNKVGFVNKSAEK